MLTREERNQNSSPPWLTFTNYLFFPFDFAIVHLVIRAVFGNAGKFSIGNSWLVLREEFDHPRLICDVICLRLHRCSVLRRIDNSVVFANEILKYWIAQDLISVRRRCELATISI